MAQHFYSPADIADACGVSLRQAQRLTRSVIGQRGRYRLTPDEFDRVQNWHKKFGRQQSEKISVRFTSL